ncbi:glycosyltransferase [Nocardia sp. CS682]|uniref:glycosyltransferase n=1 Tax=Nocardia sp. CS682 TaxID=1047172 RepID=UPI001431F9F3|nr:glycosyltransferase [Nocardia sp. CS682]
MATRDDYDGVYFTVTALSLYHREVADRIELLVIDNDEEPGPVSEALRSLATSVDGLRYLSAPELRGPAAVKDRLFREARGEWVLCIDCHVLLEPGALARLLDFIDAHPDCDDLLHGPLIDRDMIRLASHSDPVWAEGMFGRFSVVTDPRAADLDGAPFEIGMHGMGLFACRKATWLGFNPRFTGHGGEEGYLHAKYRAAGRRVLCLPFLRWTHRFDRPDRPSAPHSRWERFRNHMIGWEELGLPTEAVVAHYRQRCGDEQLEQFLARWHNERNNPFTYFDAIYCINLDDRPDRLARLTHRLQALDIAERTIRVSAIATPNDPAVGCALSHRAVLAAAHRDGLDNVLVLEDDAVFLSGTPWILRRSLRELRHQQWDLFYLGGFDHCAPRWRHAPELLDDCEHLADATGTTTTHAVAYHRNIFERLLAELPDNDNDMGRWIAEHKAIDIFYAGQFPHRALRCVPAIATQENLVIGEDPDMRDQFNIDPIESATVPPNASAETTPEPTVPSRGSVSRRTAPRTDRSGVAVVIPVHNGAEFLDQALGSLAAQTVPAEQIVVVDDASHDNSCEIVGRWKNILPLNLVQLRQQVGIGQARQTAMAAVTSRLITQLDADDMFLPNHIAVMKDTYLKSPGLVATTRLALIDTGSNPAGELRRTVEFTPEPTDQLIHLLTGNYLCIGALFSIDDYENVGGYHRIRYAEDWDLWLRFAAAGIPFTRAPEPTYVHRIHPASITKTTSEFALVKYDVEVLNRFLSKCTDTTHRRIAKLAILQRVGRDYLTELPTIPRIELCVDPVSVALIDDHTLRIYDDQDLGTVMIGNSPQSTQQRVVIVSSDEAHSQLEFPISSTGKIDLNLRAILVQHSVATTTR